jgi:hypothetical protein
MRNEHQSSGELRNQIWATIIVNLLVGMPMVWVLLFYGFVAVVWNKRGFPKLDRYHLNGYSWIQDALVILPLFCVLSVLVAVVLQLALTFVLHMKVSVWLGYSALLSAIVIVVFDFGGWISWFFTYSQ